MESAVNEGLKDTVLIKQGSMGPPFVIADFNLLLHLANKGWTLLSDVVLQPA